MADDRPVLGIILMIAFCALIPFGDALAKLLGERVALIHILLARFGLQAVILLPVWVVTGGTLPREPAIWRAMVLRTVLHITGIGLMVTALRYLPLADAIAIAFVMPFILLLLGWWILDEEVGARRLIGCGVGFAGTLMVVQPAFADVGWPAFIPFAVAFVFAFFILSTRQLTRRVDSTALQAMSGMIATAMLLAALPFLPPAARTMPELWNGDGGLLLVMGVVGTIAHYLMTLSLRFAPASTLAPMQYLEIPFATLIGWLIFADLPNRLAAIGICVTTGAGLYVLYREHKVSRGMAREKLRRAALQAEPPGLMEGEDILTAKVRWPRDQS